MNKIIEIKKITNKNHTYLQFHRCVKSIVTQQGNIVGQFDPFQTNTDLVQIYIRSCVTSFSDVI